MKMASYSDESSFPVQKRMIEEASQIPGVTAVGTIDEIPLSTGGSSTPVWREGTQTFAFDSITTAHFFTISPDCCRLRDRLVAGRDFTWHDDNTTRM